MLNGKVLNEGRGRGGRGERGGGEGGGERGGGEGGGEAENKGYQLHMH